MENLFEKLGLSQDVLKAIKNMGFVKPSPIQEKAIPEVLGGHDIIGQAQTGTGKTLAFGSAILSKINESHDLPQALIISPTRELAMQINEEIKRIGKYKELTYVCVYGGSEIEKQIKIIKKGVDVVIGTPGRIMDLMRRKVLKLQAVDYVVLDEADEMLKMGFVEDVETILEKTNSHRQTVLFSATMPQGIKKIAKKYMKEDYQHIAIKQKTQTATTVKQYYYEVKEKDRFETLCRLIDVSQVQTGIIFCRTKRSVDEVVELMQKANYSVEAMHGDLNQNHRMNTLRKLKTGAIQFLVATDVAARGIDVENVSHVINYGLPQEVEAYVHRIGRTGRANKKGIAYTIISPRDHSFLKQIEKETHSTIEKGVIPTLTEIKMNKVNRILSQAEDEIFQGHHKKFKSIVNEIDETMLPDFTATLIQLVYHQQTGYAYTKETITTPRKKKKGASEGFVRLFVTAGTMDKVKKGDIIDFFVEKANVNREDIQGIDIKRKFTFVNIRENQIEKVLRNCQKEKIHNRRIEIEVANQK